jgi:CheY-like chemotaxis protein
MRKVILLVEDNATDEKLTVLAFRKCGVANDVVVKRDGAAALDYLNEPAPPSRAEAP